MQFSSARWVGTNFIAAERDAAYAIFNASLDYTTSDGRYSIGAYIRNIRKTAYITGAIEHAQLVGLDGANVSEPRVVGVRLTAKFGAQ